MRQSEDCVYIFLSNSYRTYFGSELWLSKHIQCAIQSPVQQCRDCLLFTSFKETCKVQGLNIQFLRQINQVKTRYATESQPNITMLGSRGASPVEPMMVSREIQNKSAANMPLGTNIFSQIKGNSSIVNCRIVMCISFCVVLIRCQNNIGELQLFFYITSSSFSTNNFRDKI